MKRSSKLAVGFACALVGTLGAGSAEAQAKKINACTKIDQPGSYRVTRNLLANGDCIQILTSFVSLNLGGFSLFGDGTGGGVTTDTNIEDLEGIDVRNGNVLKFQAGIDLLSAQRSSVRRIRADHNVGDGIRIGVHSIITGSQAHENGGVGIRAGASSTISNSTASFNGSHGISGSACVVTENTTIRNGGAGVHAVPGSAAVVIGNAINTNDGNGISISNGVVRENTVISNDANGIDAGCPTSIVGNTASVNTLLNIRAVGPGCVLSDNATN